MILAFTLVVCLYIASKKRRAFRYIEIPNYAEHSLQTNVNFILNDESIPKIPSKKLKLGETIGKGGQAIVKEAEYKGKKVAAKSILHTNEDDFAAFLREVKLLCMLKHDNIIQTFGISIIEKDLWLIVERMDTDLSKVLPSLNPKAKLSIARQICSAIAFLHSFDPPVLHR